MGGTHRIGVLGITAGAIDFERDDPLTALVAGRARDRAHHRPHADLYRPAAGGKESAEQLSRRRSASARSPARSSRPAAFPGLIYLTAVLSVSIGLFNLFPVPMLDGGHLFFYLIEAVRGRPLSPRLQDLGFRIGFALVIMLFIFVTFNDIANISGIFVNS